MSFAAKLEVFTRAGSRRLPSSEYEADAHHRSCSGAKRAPHFISIVLMWLSRMDRPMRNYIASVSQVRNVLAHSAGFVRERDCGHAGALVVTWLGYQFELVGVSTGQIEHVYQGGRFEPYIAQDPEGVHFNMRLVGRQRSFAVGQSVILSPHELNEICLMYFTEARAVIEGVEAMARSHDVPFRLARQAVEPQLRRQALRRPPLPNAGSVGRAVSRSNEYSAMTAEPCVAGPTRP